MRLTPLLAAALLAAAGCAPQLARPAPAADRQELAALEEASHRWWLESRLDRLDDLMAADFRFVAMNGAVETKAEILGTDGAPRAPRPLRIEGLVVRAQEVVLSGDLAVVIALMEIDATVAGGRLPREMRVLSVFAREGPASPWRLATRSITPILTPGAATPTVTRP